METNCGAVHPFSARGEHEEAEQHRVQYGGVWGGVQSTALHPRHLFSPPTKNGCLLQETTDYPWGRQFYFLEQVKFLLLVCFLKVVKTLIRICCLVLFYKKQWILFQVNYWEIRAKVICLLTWLMINTCTFFWKQWNLAIFTSNFPERTLCSTRKLAHFSFRSVPSCPVSVILSVSILIAASEF